MDLSLVELKIAQLDHKIDLFFDNVDKVICDRFCSGRSMHASVCYYGSTGSAASGKSLPQKHGNSAASTGHFTRCFNPTYVVSELYCGLHCAEPFPTVRSKTLTWTSVMMGMWLIPLKSSKPSHHFLSQLNVCLNHYNSVKLSAFL